MMKKSLFILFIAVALINSTSSAQTSKPMWTAWEDHPCYQGLQVSVLNMGFNPVIQKYDWGVRIKNNYPKEISLSYLLTVGGENADANKFQYHAFYIKPGEVRSEGEDRLTAITFKTSSEDWVLKIREVCFEGYKCSVNDCWASCDVSPKKINQPCGLEGAQEKPTTKPNTVIDEKKDNTKPVTGLEEGDYTAADGSENFTITKYNQKTKDNEILEAWVMEMNGKQYVFRKLDNHIYIGSENTEGSNDTKFLRIKGGKICLQDAGKGNTVPEKCYFLKTASANNDDFQDGKYVSEIDKTTAFEFGKTANGMYMIQDGQRIPFKKTGAGKYERDEQKDGKYFITNPSAGKLCMVLEKDGAKQDFGCFAYSGGPIKETAPVVGANSSFSGIWQYEYTLVAREKDQQSQHQFKGGLKLEMKGDEIRIYEYPDLKPWMIYSFMGRGKDKEDRQIVYKKASQTQYNDIGQISIHGPLYEKYIKTSNNIYLTYQSYGPVEGLGLSHLHFGGDRVEWGGAGLIGAIVFISDTEFALYNYECPMLLEGDARVQYFKKISN